MGFTAGAMWEALGGAAKDPSGECGVERCLRARVHGWPCGIPAKGGPGTSSSDG